VAVKVVRTDEYEACASTLSPVDKMIPVEGVCSFEKVFCFLLFPSSVLDGAWVERGGGAAPPIAGPAHKGAHEAGYSSGWAGRGDTVREGLKGSVGFRGLFWVGPTIDGTPHLHPGLGRTYLHWPKGLANKKFRGTPVYSSLAADRAEFRFFRKTLKGGKKGGTRRFTILGLPSRRKVFFVFFFF